MKNNIKKSDFDFEYTGSDFSEKEIIKNGYQQLSGKELFTKINNKIIFGDYPNGYKFVTEINKNGVAEGINHVGSYDVGDWTIDYEKHTLQLAWKNGWINTLTRAYNVNENIEFFDVDSGLWRTTFKIFKDK